ncbi:ASCH domain-containing protein [Nonomuraea soli]
MAHNGRVEIYDLGVPGEMRDRLVAAVVSGVKSATSSLKLFYGDGDPLPEPGRFLLADSSGVRGIVEVVRVELVPLGQVGDDVAHAEGEGFADAAAWRAAHEDFWAPYLNEPLTDDDLVVVEHFTFAPSG